MVGSLTHYPLGFLNATASLRLKVTKVNYTTQKCCDQKRKGTYAIVTYYAFTEKISWYVGKKYEKKMKKWKGKQ